MQYTADITADEAKSHAGTGGMVDTTVGEVLIKFSIQWHVRRQVHSSWLYRRERHLRAARQMAVDATDAVEAQASDTAAGAVDSWDAAAESATA